jgi:uncharacterized membrane protein
MTQCIYFFVIGSFLGWILEITYKIVTKNYERLPGILNSPFCILYGFGTVICNIIASITQNIILQFILCFLLLSVIEYITYDLLYNIYNIKLWNYSKLKLNINGKICLIFSLSWAFLGVSIIQFLIPVLNNWFYLNNNIALKTILLGIITYIAWDFLVSSKRLLNIDENYNTQKHTAI